MQLTIIIPAYNAERYVSEAIGSITAQTDRAEIILVDDGSTDHTASIAANCGVAVLQQKHRGAAAARNLGLRYAHGDFVFFLDADDISCSDALETMLHAITGDTCGVFGNTVDFISPELTPEEKTMLIPRSGAYPGILPGASLFRREVFEQVGMFDETLSSGEVVDWMIRFRNSGLPSVTINDTVLKRRLHMNNTGRLNKQKELSNYAAILRKMRKL